MKKINLNSAAFLGLGVFFLLTPALSQAIITSLVTAFYRNIDLLVWVNLAQNFWILNLLPKVVGAALVAGFVWKHLKTRFKCDLPKIKVQTTRLATYSLLFMLCAGLFIFADVPVSDAATTALTGYILDTPVAEYAWLIGNYSDGSFYAIDGSTWDNKVTGVGSTAWAAHKTNSTKITELTLAATTSGTIFMKDVAFNMGLFSQIPANVKVICSYRAEYYEYINSADSTGSPYTVSVGSGVNAGYYLGQDSEGRICWSSTNATTVFQNVRVSNVTISLAKGIYPVDLSGLLISDVSNFAIIGQAGATITYNYNGQTPQEMLHFLRCNNIVLRNIIFDMGYVHFTNPNDIGGMSWILKIQQTNTITIDNCQFLNAPVDDIVTDTSNHIMITNSIFNNTGEHPLYTDTGTKDLQIYNSQFYNWAKWIRGYLKLQNGETKIANIYMEPNQDGRGFPNTAGVGGGAYGFVFNSANGADVSYVTMVGDGNEGAPAIQNTNAKNIFFSNMNITQWGSITFGTQSEIYYGSFKDSYLYQTLIRGSPMLLENVVLDDPLGYSQIDYNNTKWVTVSINYKTGTQNYPVLYLGVGGTQPHNIQLKNVNFYGWHFQGISATSSHYSTIDGSYFDMGFSSWGINGGGDHLTIQRCTFNNNATSGPYTIYIQGGQNMTLLQNNIMTGLTKSINASYVSFSDYNFGYP